MAQVKFAKHDRYPSWRQRLALWEECGLEAANPDVYKRDDITAVMRRHFERSLFAFSKWIVGNRDLAPLHDELCAFLTDFRRTRRKLALIPVGHLKTSVVSKSVPLHILIQPPDHDIYFTKHYSGQRGQNARLVLGAENKDKAADNLGAMADALMTNGFLAWLWPHCVWDGPNDARRWTTHEIEIPRTVYSGEASISAFGAETPIVGKHFDGIFPDDLATTKAALSMKSMQRAKVWLDRSWSRLHEPYDSIHMGVGTHQNADDIYVEWRKMESVETLIRSIEEPDEEGKLRPIWPERYTTEKIAKLRADTDAITWALFYMNQPVSSQWTAMDWTQLREFRWVDGESWGFQMPRAIEFAEDAKDEEILKRRRALETPLGRFANGIALHQSADREQAIRRHFGPSMTPEQIEHMKMKYGERSPAATSAKDALEHALGVKR